MSICRSIQIALGLSVTTLTLGAQTATPAKDTSAKARQALKKATAAREKQAGGRAATNAPALRLATPQELERLYLDGRITAKEYQRKLADYRQQPTVVSVPESTPPTAVLPATPTRDEVAEDKVLNDFERKFDRLLEEKAARERSTPAPPAAAVEPKTQREKLDWLLKQYLDGKLSEADYEQRRAKAIAEPE